LNEGDLEKGISQSRSDRRMDGNGKKIVLPWVAEQTLMSVTEPLNILDRDYRIVWANKARAELHKMPLDEMIGKFCFEAFQRSNEPCDGCPVTSTLKTGQPSTRERFAIGADGSRTWTDTHSWPIFDDDGEITYVTEYARNITDRKLTEKSMKYIKAFQQSVIDGLPNPVMVVGTDYRIRLANKAACRTGALDGSTEPPFCYSIFHNCSAPCSDVDHPCPLERVRESGKPVTLVHEHYMSNREKRIIEVVASPLHGPHGDFEGIIESTSDVTEQVRQESEIGILYVETARRLKHLSALRSIDMAISSSLDLRVTLEVFLDQVTSNLNVDAAALLLYNEHTQTLEFSVGRGFHSKAICRTRLQLGEGHAGRAALERRIINIPDLRAAGAFKTLRENGEEFVAYYAAPLISKGHIKGVVEVFHRSSLSPDSEWLNFLDALSVQASIAIENAALFDNLHRSNIELSLAYNATLESWARALDMRDKVTEEHSQRVARMTTQIGRAMGMRDDELVHAYRGALLHDIGKLCIPDSILFKAGPLNTEEWEIMRRHPADAYSLLSTIPYLKPALEIPYCHHEKWDGTGYPNGLKGEEIPLSARIFAIVDVWDAMRSDRPYRRALSAEKVNSHILSLSAIHFDPNVVAVFSAMDKSSYE
jgi:PAS domain S-box-containing protein